MPHRPRMDTWDVPANHTTWGDDAPEGWNWSMCMNDYLSKPQETNRGCRRYKEGDYMDYLQLIRLDKIWFFFLQGSLSYQPKQCAIFWEIPQKIPEIRIDPTNMGHFMTPVV